MSLRTKEYEPVNTCDVGTLPQVEVGHQLAVEDDHVKAGVVEGGALGHVQVDQRELTLFPDDVDGGNHRTACQYLSC